ncbi:MAG: hypothetical protein JKY01_02715 [Pseudomonadales bacterium]|nr:hypothetical protein [Pseudomonadales bacterium]
MPENIYEYAIGFLLGGFEGVKNEGTVNTIMSFYSLPDQTIDFILGIGNYSGAFLDGKETDSGYMKTFTALGFPATVLVYLGVSFILMHTLWETGADANSKSFFISVFILLIIAELKEPFLFQGYSARLIWLIFGVFIVYSHRWHRIKKSAFYAFNNNRNPRAIIFIPPSDN